MKVIANLILYALVGIIISACGTGQYLGFEKKKVPLKGKRVSVLKDVSELKKDSLSTSVINLSNPLELIDWRQSYNSPSHVGLNYISNSKLNKIKKIVKGKGERSNEKILAQPLISNNKLLFLDAVGNIYAFDLIKKKLDWKKSISINEDKGHSIGGGIAVDDNFLFIGSPYAEIFCLELKTGNIVWKNNTITPVRATPTLADNKVIVLTLDNRTLAFEKEDGSLIWEHQGIQNTTSIIGEPKVAVDGNLVLVPYSNGDIFALNLINGRELWKQTSINIEQSETSNSFSDINANPVILKNIIIVASTSGKVFALNKKNGNFIWEQYLNTTQTPLVNGNNIFVIHNNKELINIDLKNGKIRWITEILTSYSSEKNYLWLTPVLINNQLVVVGGDKSLLILSPYNGELEKKISLPSIPATSPIVVKKKVFLMLKNSEIISID